MGGGGDKAKTDVETIMTSLGYHNIGMRQRREKSSVKAYFITLASVMRGVSRLRSGDTLLLQYPLKKYYDFVVKRAVAKGVRVITLIHDLGSFRRKKLTVGEEIRRLSYSSVVIVHSEAMRRWLSDNGLKVPMVLLGLWDYLSDSKPSGEKREVKSKPTLMFAGNCSPTANGWIYKLGKEEPDVDVILYGNGFDCGSATSNLHSLGHVESDTLIATAKGEYGVAWYGDSLDGGEGALGEYLQYNSPHKISLYLRSGMPVIIWDKAGLADVVRRLGIGVCVPSLSGIGKVLAAVTPEQYTVMLENVSRVSEALSRGESVGAAIAGAEKIIAKNIE